ncbi:MAG: glycosyl transferase, family 2 [Candidatus Frackibacter sp. T328-2]|nr:MAG: glycosyl transferase, family 2 [Candidatus Frackibacter sp. T328-2]
MNDQPKVSILIPVYNRENLIKETLDSALSQTFDDFEIIVVDNKSTDNTFQILEEMGKEYDKLKVFQNASNLGPVGNWKVCLEHAKGEYIKILWSDDLIAEDFLEKTVPVLEENEDIGFVYSKVEIFPKDEKKLCYALGESGEYKSQVFLEGALLNKYSVPVSPGCALFRKNDVVIYDTIPNGFEIEHKNTGAGIDLLIFLEVLKKYSKFYYIDEVLSFFRSHKNSFSIANDLYREYMTAKTYFIKKYSLKSYISEVNSNILVKEAIINNFLISKNILLKYYCNNEKKFLKIDFGNLFFLFMKKVFKRFRKLIGVK